MRENDLGILAILEWSAHLRVLVIPIPAVAQPRMEHEALRTTLDIDLEDRGRLFGG